MRVIERIIPYRTRSDIFTIYPLADAHFGTVACDEARLEATLDEINTDPKALYLWLGDQFDSINPGDKRFDVSVLPRWLLEAYYAGRSLAGSQRDELIRRVLARKKLVSKCLCVVQGNHELKILHDYGIDMYHPLEEALRVKADERLDLDMSGMLILRFQQITANSETPGHTYTMTIYLHHGWGGGDLAGGIALKLEREMGRFEADMVLMGHVHKVQIIPRARPIRVNAALQLEQPPDVQGAWCGSFMRSRVQDVTTYPEFKGLGPSSTSRVLIRVKPFDRTFSVTADPLREAVIL